MRRRPGRIVGFLLRRALGRRAAEAALGDLLEKRCREAERLGRFAAELRFLRRLLSLLAGCLLQRPLPGLTFDLRHATRALLRRPLPSLVAVLTIGLGIGANAAVFAVVDTVLLRGLPYPAPEELVEIWKRHEGTGAYGPGLDGSALPALRARDELFARVEAFDTGARLLTGAGEPDEVPVAAVTPGLHGMLGARPALGRLLGADDVGEPVALLAHRTWERRFGADPDVLGRPLVLDDVPHAVIGVLPPSFRHPSAAIAAWVPLSAEVPPGSLRVIVRLRPGVGPPALRAALEGLTSALRDRGVLQGEFGLMPQRLAEISALLTGADDRRALLLMLGCVALVLTIAVANLAQLRVAQLVERRGELAVAAALGAGRGRLVRRLVVESLLLAVAGGLAGLVAARWANDAVVASAPASIGLFQARPVRVDARVILLVAAATLVIGLLAGLLAVLRLPRGDLSAEIAAGAAAGTATRGHRRLRAILVTAEVAVSVVLLVGAGLVARELLALHRVEPGFDFGDRRVVEVTLGESRYPDAGSRHGVLGDLLERLEALPAVQAVAVADGVPPRAGAFASLGALEIDGAGELDIPSGRAGIALLAHVDDGYFDALGLAVLRGRGFRPDDGEVAVVNEDFARRFWPRGGAVGARFRLRPGAPWTRIVGVVPDVRHTGFAEADDWLEIYRPLGDRVGGRSYEMLLRTAPGTAPSTASVVDALRSLDPDLPVSRVETLRERFSADLGRQRFQLGLMGALAAIAQVLAAIGLFGVVSMTVVAGRRELAVRVALGADPGRVFRGVLGHGLALAATGALLGGLVGWALARALGSLLFEVDPLDPAVYAVAAAVAVGVAALACTLPARRATRVDPARVLRGE